MEQVPYPLNLYFTHVQDVTTLDLSRGEDDYRKIFIAEDKSRKIVIKQCSNSFSNRHRIEGWFKLMDAYRSLGIYCPAIVSTLFGEQIHEDCIENRSSCVFAEEFAKYKTAEQIGLDQLRDSSGKMIFLADLLRSLGKIANARLDLLDFPSAYCLLEPFSPPDRVDEATDCAEIFREYVNRELPEYSEKVQSLLTLFYKNQKALREIYSQLPTSCFQADLNDSNILLDEDHCFVGLIDFNLCGREPILNYAVREALWNVRDYCLYGANGERLYYYNQDLDKKRIDLFLQNMTYIQEYYEFNKAEREAFPILFRYMNSFWWHQIDEIKRVKDDPERVLQIFDWLAFQMTRSDVQLL